MTDPAADHKHRARQIMADLRKVGGLPSSTEIIREAFEVMGYSPEAFGPEQVRRRFNELLYAVFQGALPVLESHEERTYAATIAPALMKEYPEQLTAAEVVAEREGFSAGVNYLMGLWYPVLRSCFLSISQSRKSRGGKDFELQIEGLLTLAGFPYEKQIRGDRTDLVLPSEVVYRDNPNIGVIVSAKRTLRERWREVVEELMKLRAPNVYLFTADHDITTSVAQNITGHNIYLVVWDDLKAAKLGDISRALGYTEWATGTMEVMRQRWPSAGATTGG